MTDERDVPSDVSQAYRSLGAEEPPRALDDAILAAARRPTRPWAQRWGLPVSLAAVLVLSLTVTLRIADEQPELARPQPRSQAQPEKPAGPAPAAQAPAAPPVVAEAAKPDMTRSRAAAPAPGAEPKAFPAPPAAPEPAKRAASAESAAGELRRERAADTAVAGAAASRGAAEERERASRDVAAARSAAPALAKLAQETPEQELERIARLRAESKHEDADKALAEFRKRFPEFKIPEPMLQRVERR
jgi:hypothetical protein